VHGTVSIHKDTQANHGDAKITEHSTGNLPGQYTSNGRIQTEPNRTGPVYM